MTEADDKIRSALAGLMQYCSILASHGGIGAPEALRYRNSAMAAVKIIDDRENEEVEKSWHPEADRLGGGLTDQESSASENLRTNQRQLDQDGAEVGVSRQALDETLAALGRLTELRKISTVATLNEEMPSALSALIDDFPAPPWRLHENGDANSYAIMSADNNWVTSFLLNGEMWVEKHRVLGRLFTAAPSLLSSLLGLVGRPLRYNGNRIEIDCLSHSDAMQRVFKARAALKSTTAGDTNG